MDITREFELALYPPDYRGARRFVVLHAYFDESGTNPTDDAFVLAGYMFTPENSRPFSLKWQDLMEKWKLPYFHMVDFAQEVGAYSTWREEEVRDERLNLLLDLIKKYATAGFGVALPNETFHEVYGSDANPVLKYLIAGRQMMWEVSQVNREARSMIVSKFAETERVAYIMEAGGPGVGRFETLFNAYLKHEFSRHLFRIMSITKGIKQDYKPLQAADILAYEMFKRWSGQYGSESKDTRYVAEELGKVPHVYKNISAETLQEGKDAMWRDVVNLRLL